MIYIILAAAGIGFIVALAVLMATALINGAIDSIDR